MKAIFYNGRVYAGEDVDKQAFLVEDDLFIVGMGDSALLYRLPPPAVKTHPPHAADGVKAAGMLRVDLSHDRGL